MYSNRPLNEISHSPALFFGVTLIEAMGLILLSFVEAVWIFGWFSVISDGAFVLVFCIFGGLFYIVYRVISRARSWGKIKRELPGELAYMYAQRQRRPYLTGPILLTYIGALMVFGLVLPLFLSFFGVAGPLVAVCFHLSFRLTRWLTENVDVLKPNHMGNANDELISCDTTFRTSD